MIAPCRGMEKRASEDAGVLGVPRSGASGTAVTGSGALVSDPRWREHLAAVGELGLSFDLQLTPSQVPGVADVLATLPSTPVALCHCGSPWDQTPAGLKSWRKGIELLAQLPQVSVKISGLGMFDHDWTIDSIRPIVEGCIDVFGPGDVRIQLPGRQAACGLCDRLGSLRNDYRRAARRGPPALVRRYGASVLPDRLSEIVRAYPANQLN